MHLALLIAFGLAVASPAPAVAPTPSADHTPPSIATPSIPDPCGSILSLVTRPTVATSACTVRPHHVIMENGWSNTVTTGPGGGESTSFAQTFIHFGTWDPHLEFTITPPNWNRSNTGGAVADGASDIAFGAKYELGYDANAVWGIGAQVSVPSGDAGFTASADQYTADANWSVNLGPEYSLGGTMAFSTLAGLDASGAPHRFGEFNPSFVLSASLPAASQVYAEYAYFSHAGLALPGRSLIDAGYIRDLTPSTQADVEYGYSPTKVLGQQLHYIGIGISFMH